MAYCSKGKKGFAVGVIVGGLVGGVTALLLAPKNGEKMRRDLAKKYQCVSDRTCDLIDGMCEQTSQLVDKAKDMACCAKKTASKIYRRK